MLTIWSCTCSRCGREVASGDRLDFHFRLGGWRYDRDTHKWICDECADAEKKKGAGDGR